MGLSEQWLAVRSNHRDASDALAGIQLELLGEAEGWLWARGGLGKHDLDPVIADVARRAHAPAFGGWVADSDCAYLAFATAAGVIAARVVINETLPFGEEIEELKGLWTDLDARSAAFSSLADWAGEYAPQSIDPTRLASEMPGAPGSVAPTDAPGFSDDPWYDEADRSGWVFAEDGVRLVYQRLGLPNLDEIVFPNTEPEDPDALREPILYIAAPDVESMQVIFDRLHPRFGDRFLVSTARDRQRKVELLAQRPQGEPADPPNWLAELTDELSQCLRENGIEYAQVSLISGNGQLSVWPVAASQTRR